MSTQDSRLIIERLKIFSDGSLGAETAAMRAAPPIASDKGQKGVLIHSGCQLSTMIRNATALNYRLEVHAIGDAAAEQVLDAFLESFQTPQLAEHRMEDWRPVLTHCQILGEDLLQKMKTLNVVANVQPSFVPTGF